MFFFIINHINIKKGCLQHSTLMGFFCDGKNKYFFLQTRANKYFFLQTRAKNKNPLNRKKCIFARFLNISNLIIHYGKN